MPSAVRLQLPSATVSEAAGSGAGQGAGVGQVLATGQGLERQHGAPGVLAMAALVPRLGVGAATLSMVPDVQLLSAAVQAGAGGRVYNTGRVGPGGLLGVGGRAPGVLQLGPPAQPRRRGLPSGSRQLTPHEAAAAAAEARAAAASAASASDGGADLGAGLQGMGHAGPRGDPPPPPPNTTGPAAPKPGLGGGSFGRRPRHGLALHTSGGSTGVGGGSLPEDLAQTNGLQDPSNWQPMGAGAGRAGGEGTGQLGAIRSCHPPPHHHHPLPQPLNPLLLTVEGRGRPGWTGLAPPDPPTSASAPNSATRGRPRGPRLPPVLHAALQRHGRFVQAMQQLPEAGPPSSSSAIGLGSGALLAVFGGGLAPLLIRSMSDKASPVHMPEWPVRVPGPVQQGAWAYGGSLAAESSALGHAEPSVPPSYAHPRLPRPASARVSAHQVSDLLQEH